MVEDRIDCSRTAARAAPSGWYPLVAAAQPDDHREHERGRQADATEQTRAAFVDVLDEVDTFDRHGGAAPGRRDQLGVAVEDDEEHAAEARAGDDLPPQPVQNTVRRPTSPNQSQST